MDCRLESLDSEGWPTARRPYFQRIFTHKPSVIGDWPTALGIPIRLYTNKAFRWSGKAFQLGLRIEQPQENVNRHKYGKKEYLDILGAADYSMVANGERDLYSFCMCAGGIVMPSVSEPERFLYQRDEQFPT